MPLSPSPASPTSPTSLDYALRLSPAGAQPALGALRDWWNEIAGVTREVSDPAVAAAKLAWWRRELQSGWAGTPQHPRLLALQQQAPYIGVDGLMAVIDAVETQARQTRFLDESALLRWAGDHGGAALAAAGEILAKSVPSAGSLAPAGAVLGRACALVAAIRGLGRAAQSGRLLVPIEDLQHAGLRAHELLARSPDLLQDARYRAVMDRQATRARQHMAEALPAVRAAAPRRLTRGLRVLGALHLALLDDLQRSGYPVLQQHVMLSPVRRAWIAARTW